MEVFTVEIMSIMARQCLVYYEENTLDRYRHKRQILTIFAFNAQRKPLIKNQTPLIRLIKCIDKHDRYYIYVTDTDRDCFHMARKN